MNENQAAMILDTAIDFLANKHGVTKAQIVEAIQTKNVKICTQLTELLTSAITAW